MDPSIEAPEPHAERQAEEDGCDVAMQVRPVGCRVSSRENAHAHLREGRRPGMLCCSEDATTGEFRVTEGAAGVFGSSRYLTISELAFQNHHCQGIG